MAEPEAKPPERPCPTCGADLGSEESCFGCGYTTPTPTVTRGTIIAARYEVQALLGRGGMGLVFKAHDRVLDEDVALKMLRSDVVGSADVEKRFLQEIKLARKVRHRNVCGIHEFGQDGRTRYIAMELIRGSDLKHQLRSGPFEPALAYDVTAQAADGLHAIHEVGIVHRDLKTANIMRDDRGCVRLMDFGIAKAIGSGAGMTATGLVVGTPEYMSPEQAGGRPLGVTSDIYSLGVVFYELLTGRLPFSGDTPLVILVKHLQDPPPLDGEAAAALPREAVPVLRRALAKVPTDRFASAQDMAAALREVAAGRPLPNVVTAEMPMAQPPGAAETVAEGTPIAGTRAAVTPPTPASPGPGAWRVVAGGLAALLLLGVAGWLVHDRGRGPAPASPTPQVAAAPTTDAIAPVREQPAAAAPASLPPPAPTPTTQRASTVRPAAPRVAAAAVPAPPSVTLAPVFSVPAPPPAVPTPAPALPTTAPAAPPSLAGPARPVVRAGDLVVPGPGVTAPKLLGVVDAVFPPVAKRMKREAHVVVRALVDEKGRVLRTELSRPDASGLGFNEAALEAVARATFRPARYEDLPVKMWANVPVDFIP